MVITAVVFEKRSVAEVAACVSHVAVASSFIIGDGTGYVTNSLAQIKTLLTVGTTTNFAMTNCLDTATTNYIMWGNGTYWRTQALVTAIQFIDGAASGVDADTVDGLHAAAFPDARIRATYKSSRAHRPMPHRAPTDCRERCSTHNPDWTRPSLRRHLILEHRGRPHEALATRSRAPPDDRRFAGTR